MSGIQAGEKSPALLCPAAVRVPVAAGRFPCQETVKGGFVDTFC